MIYFYGGAFNPMTLTHQRIIFDVLENLFTKNDKLIIAITTHNYKKYQFSFELRKHIIEENLKNVKDKNFEIIEQTERSWKFLNSLTDQQITIVLGEDEFNDLKAGKWHYSEELLKKYKFKIFKRTDQISATKAREIINNNIDNPELLKYISEITLNILKNN